MKTYSAKITNFPSGEILAILEQPRQFLGKEFIQDVLRCATSMLSEETPNACFTIKRNGEYVLHGGVFWRGRTSAAYHILQFPDTGFSPSRVVYERSIRL